MELWGTYERMSDADDTYGVDEQHKDNLAELARLGKTFAKRYCDNSLSAANKKIRRPDFEQALIDLAAGVIQGIAVYHPDRWSRRGFDTERTIELFEDRPDLIFHSTVEKKTYDLASDADQTHLRFKAMMGQGEVRATKRRVARRNAGFAQDAKAHPGRTAFGWNADGTVNEVAKSLLVKAREDVVAGKKIGTVRKEWIEAGIESQRYKNSTSKRPITHSTVELRIVNPRLCGYRIYAPQQDRDRSGRLWTPDLIVRDEDGNPIIGDWETIYTPDEWQELVDVLTDRKRKDPGTPKKDTSVAYFLSGWARCGECGTAVRATWYNPGTPSYEKHKFRYHCLTNEGGCGGVSRVGPLLDNLVTEAVFAHHRREIGVIAVDVSQPWSDNGRLAAIAVEKRQVMASQKAKTISTVDALKLIDNLNQERVELETQRRQHAAKVREYQTSRENLPLKWEEMTLDQKRARAQAVIETVIIHKAGRGKRFDPELIEIVWKEDL